MVPVPLRLFRRAPWSVLALYAAALPVGAQTSTDDRAARAIFAELVGINTTHDHGSTTLAAQAVRRRLVAAGFPAKDVVIAGPNPARMNIVARIRGSGARKPIVLLAHLDVVEARRDDWSLDPFTLTEKDGYFYGRGTSDIKDMAAIYVQTMVRLKREKVKLDRDVILALTADEEGGDDNGVQWLLANRRPLIEADYVINGDGGDPVMRDGQVVCPKRAGEREGVHGPAARGPESRRPQLLAGERQRDLPSQRRPGAGGGLRISDAAQRGHPGLLHPRGRGGPGHHRRPDAHDRRDRRYDRHAAAGGRLRLVQRGSAHHLRRDPARRWTREQRAPPVAAANVNCRMLPDERPEDVIEAIRHAAADTAVHVTVTSEPVPSPASPLVPEVLEPVDSITASMWPGAAVVPSMETGATDGLYFRNAGIPVYGVSGVALDADDIRAHGQDERIRVDAFYRGLDFTWRLVRALAAAP